jgi:excisionase family DNA binding protein
MRLLTIAQAAAELSCSPKTVRRIIDHGEIKVVRIGETARVIEATRQPCS